MTERSLPKLDWRLHLVRALGCDKIQGYIFSRPVTGTTVKAMLAQTRILAAA